MYRDTESGKLITIDQLKAEFEALKAENPQECSYSFSEYLNNCTSKNGFLEKIKEEVKDKKYKAEYIGKSRDKYSNHGGYAVYLFYKYRGREYMITDTHNGYSETLAEQHKREQERIDREIKEENKPQKEYKYEDTAEYGFKLFWDYVEGENKNDNV